MAHLSEQEIVRRQNLQKIIDLGIKPYPPELFPVNTHAATIKAGFQPDQKNFQDVVIAGRMMSNRVMGKASFAEIQDSSGRIQVYISRDEICPGEDKTLYDQVFKHLLDLGDFIGVKGYTFLTKTGEITIHVKELVLLSKSLRPLPVVKVDADGVVHDAFTDPEQRYRQRYVDMVVNPDVRRVFELRSRMYTSMREYLNAKGYLEVETPVLQPLYG
ncbi:MAG: OB-fold nucleic acid binding domain-containing protein, partial [Saprospiraceae bacterium]